MTASASMQAAATAGGCEVENRKGRARWVSSSRSAAEPGHVAAQHADRLGQRAHLDGHPTVQPEVVDGAATVVAQDARGVGIVDQHRGTVLLGRLDDAGQRRDVAVHAEDTVGDHEDQPVGLTGIGVPARARTREDLAQRGHVLVRVDLAPRLREAHAVDDRGVVEGIADEEVALARDHRHDPGVGGEAGPEHERRLDALELGQVALELLVERHRAGDGAHRPGAHAVVAGGPGGGLAQARVVGQAQVVVGGEADDLAAVDLAGRTLGRGHLAQRSVEVLLTQRGDLVGQEGQRVRTSQAPVQQHLAAVARAGRLEGGLVVGEGEAVGDGRADVQARLQHHAHLVPGLVHLAAVDAA